MVTGSSSGIGRAIALSFAEAGANVILHGRASSSHLQKVVDEIHGFGVEANCLYGDFADEVNWDGFVAEAWNWKGSVDVWVNNAGGDVLTGSWKEASLESKLDYLWKADVRSTLMLSKAIGQKMANADCDQCGAYSIINIGWDQAAHGMEGDSGELFATTKGAIMSMSKSLAQSLAPNVRVNCIAPGWIQTKWGESTSDAWDQRAKSESLMGRWGQPVDIASVALFLASDSSRFVSGQIIPVNGGFRFGPK